MEKVIAHGMGGWIHEADFGALWREGATNWWDSLLESFLGINGLVVGRVGV